MWKPICQRSARTGKYKTDAETGGGIMDKKRYNDLILLSQRIHEYANEQLRAYLEKTYADAGAQSSNPSEDDVVDGDFREV